MWFLLWIAMGLLMGLLAKRIQPDKDPGGSLLTICIGISGAFTGGYLTNLMGVGSVECFNLFSLASAMTASLILLLLYHRVKAE